MARLVGKTGDHKGQIFELPAEIQTIGRGKSCDIQLRDTSVSRTHASIRRVGERFVLKDEGSSYGTYIDGNPIIESDLRSGQEVRIGQTTFDFVDGGVDGRVPLPEPPDASLEYTVMHAIGDADSDEERDSTGVVRIKQRLAIALEVSGFLNSA
ncbi:MAG: FHA domain-containing protein, partial [Deltaproteobacteria bacterium]|nr:FHA domain-containing protein [Deltaproteobacteria bacterium]